jgi:hypothetical protein
MSGHESDLLARLDRIESMQAIQQLPIRYALAVDGRDLDSWVGLFVGDVNCGRHGIGRKALRSVIEPELRRFYRSIHQICGHRVTFDDPDHAQGVVYCRAEHEVGDQWVVMAIAYFDSYARRDGEWFFLRRREKHWYSVDILDRPANPFHRWPDNGATTTLPADFPSWENFWGGEDVSGLTREPAVGAS